MNGAVLHEPGARRAMTVRILARQKWLEYSDDQAMRLALDQRPRRQHDLAIGDRVCYWRAKKGSGKRNRAR